ncbi:aminotransferase class III-fold pyridoxal phosphate-dependent enzyme [Arenibacter latericius]|uniref:aminotransferase class III-fold pyridoxal phosphate-dependent enzyme n=1 Tax=Arenibacter latericius TaxID=86104 RepID=UPI00042143F5|nr:aminotransferase class III-fold pyridoxal phosphate-dependent enzyme [Arenibacter latericius]
MTLLKQDYKIIVSKLEGFIPDEIFDIHAHPFNPAHFASDAWPFLHDVGVLGCNEHRSALLRYMPTKTIHGLYFGMPHRTANRDEMNRWVREETQLNGTSLSRALKVVSPVDDPKKTLIELRDGLFCGLKVYHVYAERLDSMNASITEYAPEWMWEILNETNGILLLHLVLDKAIADIGNQKEIIRLCATYPNVRVVLAHVARSFNYRNARNGLCSMSEINNVVVDTSAVCETESFRAVFKALGARRILWGSDFAISEMRGRCVSTGSTFSWLHPEIIGSDSKTSNKTDMTLVGIESLLCLQEMCEDEGLTAEDVKDIFLNNALRLLSPHLPPPVIPTEMDGPGLWESARSVISGGTGLLSKRSEGFDSNSWPSFYSRCSGCEVWDTSGRKYIDYVGAIGAVLLGYADPEVNAAVSRRISLGSYCSLVNPQEVNLAEILLKLHPWAGKVRYARTGGEAMAIAVRIARASTGKSGIAFCGYHGWSDWYFAANLGNDKALDGHLLPGLDPRGVPRELTGTSVPFKYNDLNSLDNALKKLNGNFAAIVMEPMRSQLPNKNFIEEVAKKCSAAGGVLIIDEITSGLRYGFPGALSKIGIVPDIVVYAKAMSNGYPFAAIIGREEVMRKSNNSFISSSYWTDGIGTAAALAVIEKVQRLNVQEEVWKRGQNFQISLRAVTDRYPSCKIAIGGMPATPTLNFQLGDKTNDAKTLYVRKMLGHGFLVSSTFYLMYAHKEEHHNKLIVALDIVLKEIEEIIKSGRLKEMAGNNRNQLGFARLT